ncbi:TonB family protein [Novosphingobium aerophilum]|uniref:TonB family protein n=1 Tax=Novosphingobium aerophilum TaxID=2839843 RepID=A0A7X1KDM8_9SPHN|nr:TonB family protein [Novosphingobium aerophilum]MBC2653332.1 TonB family protein [Novosphingobium aerophilum]
MSAGSDLSAPPRVRLGVALLVAGLHSLAILGLIRAFAPDLAGRAIDAVVSTFAVEAPRSPEPRPPEPSPPPKSSAPTPAGQAAPAGRRAVPRATVTPPPRITLAPPVAAPPVAATGTADTSGARDQGAGTGAGGEGSGTGRGTAGTGQGGGSAAVKIAGEINSARDYPIATRDLRIGDRVIVAITVGTDGRPSACRVVRPSRDAQADAITCRLALARFRFRPATDGAGTPVVSVFGWQQRWFYRGGE